MSAYCQLRAPRMALVAALVAVFPVTAQAQIGGLIRKAKQAMQKPDTANNNINAQKGRYQVIPYMRLDDSDTNDWYLVDLDSMKRNAAWFDRVPPEYKNTVDFDTYVFLQAVYGRFSYGHKGWQHIIKSTVS